jgi:GGDEF domain-containing protein
MWVLVALNVPIILWLLYQGGRIRLLLGADRAMYRAKTRGKNGLVLYEPQELQAEER